MDSVLERIGPYFKALRGESDRGLIILPAAYLDDLLTELTAYFIDSPKINEALFTGTGALSTSSAKSKMAFSLGFLHSDELAELDRIRKMRNAAAHITVAVDFGDPDSKITKLCEAFHTLTERTSESFPSPKDRFMLVAGWLAVKIANLRDTVERRPPPTVAANIGTLTTRAVMLSVFTSTLVELRDDGAAAASERPHGRPQAR